MIRKKKNFVASFPACMEQQFDFSVINCWIYLLCFIPSPLQDDTDTDCAMKEFDPVSALRKVFFGEYSNFLIVICERTS